MQLQSVPVASPVVRIGAEDQSAEVLCTADGSVLSFDSRADGRRRAWLVPGGLGVQAILPGSRRQPQAWELLRLSRDQIEFGLRRGTTGQATGMVARQTITVDDWGLHIALWVENGGPLPLAARLGFALQLAAPAESTIELPPGTLSGGTEARSAASPFAWPRASRLLWPAGDVLEILGYAPLARTELRRSASSVELNLLAPGTLAGGEATCLELRLRARLATG